MKEEKPSLVPVMVFLMIFCLITGYSLGKQQRAVITNEERANNVEYIVFNASPSLLRNDDMTVGSGKEYYRLYAGASRTFLISYVGQVCDHKIAPKDYVPIISTFNIKEDMNKTGGFNPWHLSIT